MAKYQPEHLDPFVRFALDDSSEMYNKMLRKLCFITVHHQYMQIMVLVRGCGILPAAM
jgi:hypothetical protein